MMYFTLYKEHYVNTKKQGPVAMIHIIAQSYTATDMVL